MSKIWNNPYILAYRNQNITLNVLHVIYCTVYVYSALPSSCAVTYSVSTRCGMPTMLSSGAQWGIIHSTGVAPHPIVWTNTWQPPTQGGFADIVDIQHCSMHCGYLSVIIHEAHLKSAVTKNKFKNIMKITHNMDHFVIELSMCVFIDANQLT